MPKKCNCKLYCLFSTSIFLIVFSVAFIISWPYLFHYAVKKMLMLTDTSLTYKFWSDTTIPIYFELHMYNWTNAEDFIANKSVTPVFEDLGPYMFEDKHVRTNLTWNDNNNTVTFQQKRIWHFVPELSNGSMDDEISNVNIITASTAYVLRSRIRLIKAALDFLLREFNETLIIKKKARNLLFDGYEDKFLNMVLDLNVNGFEIPFDKIGFFYGRNDTAGSDGVFNMNTGTDKIEKLGILNSWNYMEKSTAYHGDCAAVNGTTGELWPPFEHTNNITMFVADICRSITLDYKNDVNYHGINAKKYLATDRIFDNGTKYADSACFSQGDILPSGVLNASQCQFGVPLFLSYPHFYLADSTYHTNINIKPNYMDSNEFYIVMEPNFGMPLSAQGQFQINIMIDDYKHVVPLENVKRTLAPIAWFREGASLPENLMGKAKWAVIMSNNAIYIFIGIGGVGILILCIAIYIYYK